MTGRLGPASVGGIDPHKMDPMAPAGAGITREKLAEVTTSSPAFSPFST